MFLILMFLLGGCFGSFFHVAIHRLQTETSFLTGRSVCDHCKRILKWNHLVPFFSFLFLKGKCGFCFKKISSSHFVFEIVFAFLFLTIAYFHPVINVEFFFQLIFSSFLLLLFYTDYKWMQLPDLITIPAIFTTLLFQYLIHPSAFFSYVISGLVFGGFFFIQYFFSKGKWVGDGDIRFGILLGVSLGMFLGIYALMFSYVIGALHMSFLLLLKKKKSADVVAFGTYLAISTGLFFFFKTSLIQWYLELFV